MGSGITTIGNDPVPAATDQVLIPADFLLYADSISHKIGHWVADQAERDVLYDAAAAPVLIMSPAAIWLKISSGPSVWKTIWADSGAITTGFTNGANYTKTGGFVRKLNSSFVHFNVIATVTSAVTVNGSGNIVGDPTVVTLPTGYWPALTTPFVTRWNQADGVGEVDTSGNVKLLSGTPSYSIGAGETIVLAGNFFTP